MTHLFPHSGARARMVSAERDQEPIRPASTPRLVELRGVICVVSRGRASDTDDRGDQRRHQGQAHPGSRAPDQQPRGSPEQSATSTTRSGALLAKYPDTPGCTWWCNLCASGGYYVAVAADRINVYSRNLVGSIGVIISWFRLHRHYGESGVAGRARHTHSCDNKDFLDPFSPENPAHKEHAQKMLGENHQQFSRWWRRRESA